jgi:hypothetical protein
VREAPRHEREGGADGPQLVAGDLVVGEHVRDERAGGVEVQRRLERRGVRRQVVVRRHRLDDEQDARGRGEEDDDPREPGRAADGEDDEPEDPDPEDAEERAPDVAASMNGYSTTAASWATNSVAEGSRRAKESTAP